MSLENDRDAEDFEESNDFLEVGEAVLRQCLEIDIDVVPFNHTIRLDRVRAHWGDMLRVAGSLTLGEVRGHDLIRMLSRDGKPTGLGDAFAHYGRIFKTLHLLQFVSDGGNRRMIGAQLNVTEARHRLARKTFFGQRGELRPHYREGMEDQLGALGLALSACLATSEGHVREGA
ncbi:Tn3 family transposase [Streptomyces sp. NPDC056210]|uniref:Tn3 family transposase n=1 Tax=unclassified Streptomyces TaxID=2593676 RepID=UPI0035DD0E9A